MRNHAIHEIKHGTHNDHPDGLPKQCHWLSHYAQAPKWAHHRAAWAAAGERRYTPNQRWLLAAEPMTSRLAGWPGCSSDPATSRSKTPLLSSALSSMTV